MICLIPFLNENQKKNTNDQTSSLYFTTAGDGKGTKKGHYWELQFLFFATMLNQD